MSTSTATRSLAEAEASRIVEGARREADGLRAQALAEATALCAARELAARAAWAHALEAQEETVIALACEVAAAVLGREAEASPSVLRDVTRRAFAKLRRARVAVVRVHPDDAAEAERSVRSWLPEGASPEEVDVVADASVGRGGVVVETERGRVDARLDRQLAEVARILAGRPRVV